MRLVWSAGLDQALTWVNISGLGLIRVNVRRAWIS